MNLLTVYVSLCSFCMVIALSSCNNIRGYNEDQAIEQDREKAKGGIELVVLGTIQDAGSPHIACIKKCCVGLSAEEMAKRQVACLGLIDHSDQKYYLIDATPDMTDQLRRLQEHLSWEAARVPDGIFITHAHIGHYTGLMYLGREALGARGVPVFMMPRMMNFIENNGPWSQLIQLGNISPKALEENRLLRLSEDLAIVPISVPHRDEFSETVGFRIIASDKEVLYIPDIDKWEHWDQRILDVIPTADWAFLDASFYNTEELGHRDPIEIPHPLVEESIRLFDLMDSLDRRKIRFIHLNHTNPLLQPNSLQFLELEARGYRLAINGEVFPL